VFFGLYRGFPATKRCQDSIRAGGFSDSEDAEIQQLWMERQKAAAGSAVRETIGHEPLELKQACFVTELLRAGDETESGFRQVFVFRGPL